MDIFSDEAAKTALTFLGPNIKIVASRLSKELVEKKITPTIMGIISSNSVREETLNSIIKYFESSYYANVLINTIVFKGNPKYLKELYIPLTIVKLSEENKSFNLSEETIELNKIFESYPKMMIVDKAGMGKSTIVKFLMLMALEKGEPIPICIELRKLTGDTDILDLLTAEINFFNGKATKEQIKKLISEDQFLILLDGYDEIREIDKIKVTQILQNFIKQTPNTYYLLTSRDENALDSFGDFNRFMIKPLSIDQAYDLIQKYDNGGKISKLLVEKISSENQFNSIKEFLTNPLLVSLLYQTFQYRKEIPYKKLVFYDTVFEALFNDHDLTKGGAYIHEKKSNLDICDFRKIARGLGWRTLCMDKFEFSLDELSKEIEALLQKNSFTNSKAMEVIQDLTKNVPLFCKEGNNFKWVHKSFMEYFAACYIHHDLTTSAMKSILEKMSSNNRNIKKYENLLDFFYDLNVTSFEKYIITPFIEDFIKRYDSKYINPEYEKVDMSILKYRKSIDCFVNIDLIFEKSNFTIVKARTFFDENKYREKQNLKLNNPRKMVFEGRKGDFRVELSEIIENGSLLNIFLNKKSDIFISSMTNVQLISREIFDIAERYKNNTFHINDDISNEMNRDENIFVISEFLYNIIEKDTSLNGKYFLDINKCLNFIENIKRETELEEMEIKDFLS